MQSPEVVVIDYGLGNLFSVAKAIVAVGAAPIISSDPSVISRADRLVLPGVGAFGDGMAGLRERGLVDPILNHVSGGRPIFGICLGMQLLHRESEEFGLHLGLGLLPGRVVALEKTPGFRAKVPHVGWNELYPDRSWDGSVLAGLSSGSEVYFVHSFAVTPEAPDIALAHTRYGGTDVCAAVQKGTVAGCQFHPEKSRDAGLQILRNFVRGLA